MMRLAVDRWGWVGLFVLGVGCTPPKMAVPPDVAQKSEVLTATERSSAYGALVDEGFVLGPYRVEDVDRDWSSSRTFAIGPFADKKATTGYQYRLGAGAGKLAGTCGSTTKKQALSLTPNSEVSWSATTVACSCEGTGAPATLTWGDKQNEMMVAGTRYALEPIHTTDEGSELSEPVGFAARGPAPLGAVEVTHPGRVWLNRSLDDSTKAAASCLFVGLMLYHPPQND